MAPTDPRNERDLILLRTDPRALVVEYQDTIRTIVAKYIRTGMFRPADFDDVVQVVCERFLLALPVIGKQFNGSTLVRTYVSAVLRNICLQIVRNRRREGAKMPVMVDYGRDPPAPNQHTHTRTFVALEIAAFSAIVAQFGKDRGKLLLMLKLRYRLPIVTDDILSWCPACSRADQNMLLSAFAGDYIAKTDKEIHRILLRVAQKAEGKRLSTDHFRSWTRSRIDEILSLLNGSPPISAHTEETLRLLVEDFFSPFLLK